MASETGSVQSVDRAISILQVLARRGHSSVTEIAEAVELHKSTVSRLLATLQARGLVAHLPNRGGYRLDHGIALLAEGVTRNPDLALTSRPICEALAEELGETVNLVVPEAGRAVTIDQVIGSASLTTVNWVGRRNRLHVTSAGKVFLAAEPDELRRCLAEGLKRYTEQTLTDPDELGAQLVAVREKGFGWAIEEQEIGLVAVAAPIKSLDGSVVAAIAVSGPSFRIGPDAIEPLGQKVKDAAAQISERNGYPKAG